MMKAIPLWFCLMACNCYLSAQFVENFNDGDFTSNPAWTGNTDQFIVTEGVLQLNNPGASGVTTSFLSTEAATSLDEGTTWRFFTRLDFAPSSTNQLRIYLAANRPELELSTQAYFLEIGQSGNEDAIKLYVQNQEVVQLLGQGAPGTVAAEPVLAGIEVFRSTSGEWTISADYSGGNNYAEEFSVVDTTFSILNYFGFLCRYSSTRSESFFFDDIEIDPLFVDRIPPEVISATALSSRRISLAFNEVLDSASAARTGNYTLDQGIGQPAGVSFDSRNPTQVELNLDEDLVSAQLYTITISGVRDVNQNPVDNQTIDVIFYNIQEAAPGDLIVTEFMTDPTPSRGLPEEEYIELYNRSDKVLQLEGLLINSGATPRPLPEYLLLPGAFVTVCDEDVLPEFQVFGPAIAVRTFPSLSNDDDEITILDGREEVLFSIFYQDEWYDADSLSVGGYSLELIDPNGPVDCPGNWAGSRAEKGGTPGQPNSVANLLPENIAPRLSNIVIESEFELRLTFNERMDEGTTLDVNAYAVNPAVGISEVMPGVGNEVILILAASLVQGQSYTLTLATTISDCTGNTLPAPLEIAVGLPEAATPGDLLLSEVLFHPQAGGNDFVEIYNASAKVINLNGFFIANTDKDSGDTLAMVESNYLIFPGEYLALTENREDILMKYSVAAPSRLLLNDLPTLEARSGNVTLRNAEGIVLDAFDYDEDLHFSLLDNERGVSLERLRFDQPTQSRGNWHSAAASVGFATPTAPNSQMTPPGAPGQELVNIENPRFSPDNDGFEDVLLIQVNPERPGYVANIKIFDAQGRLIKDLIRNTLLGNTELFKWDGLTNENSKARIGPYVLWIELFEPEGEVIREKKTIVVAGKL